MTRTHVLKPAPRHVDGYPAYLRDPGVDSSSDTTTDAYAKDQAETNVRKTTDFLIPLLRECEAQSVLDVGCGTGTMVRVLIEQGFDAHGADLLGLTRRWSADDQPRDRFMVIDPDTLALPFDDGALDFVFSLGAIEHVGTLDGHAHRMPNYQAIRKVWLRELFRTVRPGGWMLVGGPNRQFPVDVAHGLDHAATPIEQTLSRLARASIHKPWGENFLWSYSDIEDHLEGLPHEVRALRIDQYLGLGRVPAMMRPFVLAYLRHLPTALLATAFNPWVMALVRKP